MTAQLFTAKVMHKRLFPKVNDFTYRVYYFALPLGSLQQLNDGWRRGYNRTALLSLHDRDYGAKDGSNLRAWIDGILAQHGFTNEVANVTLVTMPRVLGYVFNPVTFWLCTDASGSLRAVLAQVNNTFGETHSYVCAHPDFSPIQESEWMCAMKEFHVSPFIERNGHYQFRVSWKEEKLGIWIDYFHENGEKQLLTSLMGTLAPLNRANVRRAFWRHPLVTLTTIALIHWQAVKLLRKGIRYIVKPPQFAKRLTASSNLTKM